MLNKFKIKMKYLLFLILVAFIKYTNSATSNLFQHITYRYYTSPVTGVSSFPGKHLFNIQWSTAYNFGNCRKWNDDTFTEWKYSIVRKIGNANKECAYYDEPLYFQYKIFQPELTMAHKSKIQVWFAENESDIACKQYTGNKAIEMNLYMAQFDCGVEAQTFYDSLTTYFKLKIKPDVSLVSSGTTSSATGSRSFSDVFLGKVNIDSTCSNGAA